MTGRTLVGGHDGRDIYRDDATGQYTYEDRKPAARVSPDDQRDILDSPMFKTREEIDARNAAAKAEMDARFAKIREREAAVDLAAKKKIAEERAEAAVQRRVAELRGGLAS